MIVMLNTQHNMNIGGICMGEVRYMIKEAAKQVNVEAHVLRYWEEELSLSINRTEMGHRYYTQEDIQLFRCIRELKEQGMQLKELKALIPSILHTREQLQLKKQNQLAIRKSPEIVEVTVDSKAIQLQNFMDEISASVSKSVVKELEYLFREKEQLEEDRYRKLDQLIRQQQQQRKEHSSHLNSWNPLKRFAQT